MFLYINHDVKAIFIHNPKCGGTTISNILCDYYGFMEVKKIDEIVNLRFTKDALFLDIIYSILEPEIWNTYYKFSITRNPYTKFISGYLFLIKYYKNITTNNHLTVKFNSSTDSFRLNQLLSLYSDDNTCYDHPSLYSLEEYISIKDNVSYFSHIHIFMTQTDMLRSSFFTIDYIGKLENIDLFFFTILTHFKLKWIHSKQKRNTSNYSMMKMDEFYTPIVLEFVNMHFSQDFINFNYHKDINKI